jgi:SAM-dependent methyltransferase
MALYLSKGRKLRMGGFLRHEGGGLTQKKLNIGCGRSVLPGWINLDAAALPGVDIVYDLERCAQVALPLDDESIDEFLLSHVIEHLHNTLPLMQELHRLAKAGAKATVRLPHGASDDAWEDPTHVRSYFPACFDYYAQPTYWRADYGYRGDWRVEKIYLIVNRQKYEGKSVQEIAGELQSKRNVVLEMVADLRAVKPIREPRRELQTHPRIEIVLS